LAGTQSEVHIGGRDPFDLGTFVEFECEVA
jgi:hypothetical protein